MQRDESSLARGLGWGFGLTCGVMLALLLACGGCGVLVMWTQSEAAKFRREMSTRSTGSTAPTAPDWPDKR